MTNNLRQYTGKDLRECTKLELFNALLKYTDAAAVNKGYNQGKKKLYYISAEFLIGKLLSNNLINLGLYDQVRSELEAAGRTLSELEEFEQEPSLGNGGLGRLAACFLDSLATLGLPADGVGLAYHCGLFHQNFAENKQSETPDRWLRWGTESWMHRTGVHYDVPFGNKTVRSTMYEINVTGYDGKCGLLRLFDVEDLNENLIKTGISFDQERIEENLTLFLYPDDSTDAGRLLRVYQEYFMVSNAAQLILDECVAKGSNLHDLADYAAIQINDTHPAMVIPELIRLLCLQGIEETEAVNIVRDICGYTNHTILAEALEKWPCSYLEKALPHLMPVIRKLSDLVSAQHSDPFVQIIDRYNNVHMANMAIHYSHSVNGVAKLHTEILKNSELAPFYKIYPEKFNNKTNGITFRRWLTGCNPKLADLIDRTIGTGWRKDSTQLEQLLRYSENADVLRELTEIKKNCKKQFADWMLAHQGAVIDPDSVYDVQAKRLHEYKRQQLNLLWAISKYLEIKSGKLPRRPITVIFGAKAAPAYTIAKDIIHAILCLSEIISADPEVSRYLKVVMIENYNVTAAEKLIPACDISEQISLASKEASGTGNMKFMLNGAVTLGTMDGANVEIAALVGSDNIYTFGLSSDEVIEHYRRADYVARNWYQSSASLKKAVDFLVSSDMLDAGDSVCLNRLRDELIGKDWFMTFPDFEDYCRTKDQILNDMQDSVAWSRKMLVNIAKGGYFSSDRTIEDYNHDIWKLEK